MTTIHPLKLFVAVLAVTFACFGTRPVLGQDTGDPVTIEKDRILIPGTNISEKDKNALNAILGQYDRSLYKLKGYANGKPGKTQGTLNDASIDSATARRAAVHAKDKNFTGSTLQVGFSSNQSISGRTSNQSKSGNTSNQSKSGNTSNQSKSGNASNQSKPENTSNQSRTGATSNQDISSTPPDASKARELVKRLTPILQKYTKTQNAR